MNTHAALKALKIQQVFPSAFALPGGPFAPRKLRGTRERGKIEGFLRRQGKPGWRPASAKTEKAPIWAAHGRQVFDALRPDRIAPVPGSRRQIFRQSG